jgi:hypothetical protein
MGKSLSLVVGALVVASCLQKPIAVPPSQPDLRGVYVASESAVFAVGEDGEILFYDGEGWTEQESGLSFSNLRGVSGTGPDDVWAVGAFGVAAHFDGSTWTRVETSVTNNLESVWAVAPDDVWSVGQGGATVHYDGTEWTRIETGAVGWLYDVWADAEVVWIAGSGVFRYDRATETGTAMLAEGGFRAVHPMGAGAVAGGLNGNLRRLDGESWTDPEIRDGVSVTDLWAGESSAWAIGYQGGGPMGRGGAFVSFDGTGWTEEDSGDTAYLRAIHGTSATNLWTVGDDGAVFRFDGTSWAPVPLAEAEEE